MLGLDHFEHSANPASSHRRFAVKFARVTFFCLLARGLASDIAPPEAGRVAPARGTQTVRRYRQFALARNKTRASPALPRRPRRARAACFQGECGSAAFR